MDMMMMQDINWLGVLVATIVTYVGAAIWFYPRVLGQMWMQAQPHRKFPADYKTSPAGMFVQFLMPPAYAIVLSILMGALGSMNGALVMLGFAIVTSGGRAISGGHPKAWWYVVGGYEALMIIVMALILAWAKTWGM